MATFNVGTAGAAFGEANYTDMAILDLLMATDDRSSEGVLYDLNGDGRTDNDSWETLLRTLANDVYTAINERGPPIGETTSLDHHIPQHGEETTHRCSPFRDFALSLFRSDSRKEPLSNTGCENAKGRKREKDLGSDEQSDSRFRENGRASRRSDSTLMRREVADQLGVLAAELLNQPGLVLESPVDLLSMVFVVRQEPCGRG